LRTIEDQAFAAVAMGFRKLEMGLSEEPVTMNGFADTQRETGVRLMSVVAGCLKPRGHDMACMHLGSTVHDEREQALISVRRHIHLARRMGCPVVVLRGASVADSKLRSEAQALEAKRSHNGASEELQEEAVDLVDRVHKKGHKQVEHLCRSLHTLAAEFPETRLALAPGERLDDLLGFEPMGWVLDDLAKQGIGYWHDVGRIHVHERFGLTPQGRWLDRYAPRMMGVHLRDSADGETELPPGTGEIDFQLIASYVPADASRVLDVNPRHGRAEILASVQYLQSKGF
jgi:sugar phosphate isomerase/epimerase